MPFFELTRFTKADGPLTKSIRLGSDGAIVSDGGACVMSRGRAERIHIQDVDAFAELIGGLNSSQAIALGRLRAELPDQVQLTTKRKLDELNGTAQSDTIARTGGHIVFSPGTAAFALLDYDTKGMPTDVADRVIKVGSYWQSLVSVLPELAHAARIARRSTSAGLYRTDTSEKLAGSDGLHIFVAIADGQDVERFLKALHARCWLHGFGWMMVGAGGQLLERSIVDRMVGASERLVFEGAPILEPPLAQDQESRRPIATGGELLDTLSTCPPLTLLEESKLRELRAREARRLAPKSTKARAAFIADQAQWVVQRTGLTTEQAARIVARQCAGILLPDVVLPFDDPDLAGTTVADVLADPARFEGATLADPLEGVEYGTCKAKIMCRSDGTPWIHSFAHGRAVYELRHDARAINNALDTATKDTAADIFVRMAAAGDLSDDETEALRNQTASRSGAGKRTLDARLRYARQERATRRAEEERQRRTAERRDPRPQITAPAPDAPWLPQMQLLNDVLGASRDLEPPMRDLDGNIVQVRVRQAANMHQLTATGVNEAGIQETRVPVADQPLLTRLDEAQLSELIERHIDYSDAEGRRPVHLGAAFVRHYLNRSDNKLPTANAVATMPMVLPNGEILAGQGLNRERRIVFRVPEELQRLLPKSEDCSQTAVAEAMRSLTDEWLCDVATDYTGKCVLIAAALTILQRLLLPERPAFFVTAGQRGGGKTTALHMVAIAVFGRRAAASAWSTSEEERRKAMFSYFAEGVPFIVWDNLPRGATISCASIEKALTADFYTDRVLGESSTRTVPAFSIQAFTGNNIAPRGDMASRSLTARLAVDRPDPENREFAHPDPLAWTEANRGNILRALYTILLGNPRLRCTDREAAKTRFKAWWHLVGAAVEYAAAQHEITAFPGDANWNARCPPENISFAKLFLDGEADEEQTSSLATVLDVLRTQWSVDKNEWRDGFPAKEVAAFAGKAEEDAIVFKAALEAASGRALKVVTATTITWRLKGLVDAPVQVGDDILALRYTPGHQGGMFAIKTI